MVVVTALLITVGALLAAAGTVGFYCVATTAPDPEDLARTRGWATVGRRMLVIGVPMLAAQHVAISGPMLDLVAGLGFLVATSYLTRAPLGRVQGGTVS
jgi:hypothetical protein